VSWPTGSWLKHSGWLRLRLMDQSQEILLGHAIFASSEYRMTHPVTVVLHVQLAIKFRSCHVCLSVCLSVRRLAYFRKPVRRKFTFAPIFPGDIPDASGISPGNKDRVRIWRSSHHGQGHKNKKGKNPYSINVKLWSAITRVLKHSEPWVLREAWRFRLRRIEWCDRHLFHVTESDHV